MKRSFAFTSYNPLFAIFYLNFCLKVTFWSKIWAQKKNRAFYDACLKKCLLIFKSGFKTSITPSQNPKIFCELDNDAGLNFKILK